jgi:putative membrane protein
MQLASRLFSASDRQRINETIQTAESLTSAEIVPVVATASGRYDRAEDLVGLWLGVLLVVAVSIFSPAAVTEPGSWDSHPLLWQTLKLVAVLLGGFLVGAVLSARIGWLRRLFTPATQLRDEVNQRARSVFFDNRVHHTQAGGGLLIYISLFEQIAVILADQQILDALGQSPLDELCQTLTQLLRSNQPADALCQTIQAAGERLRPALPRALDDVNELPDSLVTLD